MPQKAFSRHPRRKQSGDQASFRRFSTSRDAARDTPYGLHYVFPGRKHTWRKTSQLLEPPGCEIRRTTPKTCQIGTLRLARTTGKVESTLGKRPCFVTRQGAQETRQVPTMGMAHDNRRWAYCVLLIIYHAPRRRSHEDSHQARVRTLRRKRRVPGARRSPVAPRPHQGPGATTNGRSAPSTELRKAFGHDPAHWATFQEKYVAELNANPEALKFAELDEMAKYPRVTLIYAARDEKENEAVVLQKWLPEHE